MYIILSCTFTNYIKYIQNFLRSHNLHFLCCCSFNIKNLHKCIFWASTGVNFSNFTKFAPTHVGCCSMALRIFADYFKIFNINLDLIYSFKRDLIFRKIQMNRRPFALLCTNSVINTTPKTIWNSVNGQDVKAFISCTAAFKFVHTEVYHALAFVPVTRRYST